MPVTTTMMTVDEIITKAFSFQDVSPNAFKVDMNLITAVLLVLSKRLDFLERMAIVHLNSELDSSQMLQRSPRASVTVVKINTKRHGGRRTKKMHLKESRSSLFFNVFSRIGGVLKKMLYGFEFDVYERQERVYIVNMASGIVIKQEEQEIKRSVKENSIQTDGSGGVDLPSIVTRVQFDELQNKVVEVFKTFEEEQTPEYAQIVEKLKKGVSYTDPLAALVISQKLGALEKAIARMERDLTILVTKRKENLKILRALAEEDNKEGENIKDTPDVRMADQEKVAYHPVSLVTSIQPAGTIHPAADIKDQTLGDDGKMIMGPREEQEDKMDFIDDEERTMPSSVDQPFGRMRIPEELTLSGGVKTSVLEEKTHDVRELTDFKTTKISKVQAYVSGLQVQPEETGAGQSKTLQSRVLDKVESSNVFRQAVYEEDLKSALEYEKEKLKKMTKQAIFYFNKKSKQAVSDYEGAVDLVRQFSLEDKEQKYEQLENLVELYIGNFNKIDNYMRNVTNEYQNDLTNMSFLLYEKLDIMNEALGKLTLDPELVKGMIAKFNKLSRDISEWKALQDNVRDIYKAATNNLMITKKFIRRCSKVKVNYDELDIMMSDKVGIDRVNQFVTLQTFYGYTSVIQSTIDNTFERIATTEKAWQDELDHLTTNLNNCAEETEIHALTEDMKAHVAKLNRRVDDLSILMDLKRPLPKTEIHRDGPCLSCSNPPLELPLKRSGVPVVRSPSIGADVPVFEEREMTGALEEHICVPGSKIPHPVSPEAKICSKYCGWVGKRSQYYGGGAIKVTTWYPRKDLPCLPCNKKELLKVRRVRRPKPAKEPPLADMERRSTIESPAERSEEEISSEASSDSRDRFVKYSRYWKGTMEDPVYEAESEESIEGAHQPPESESSECYLPGQTANV